jgi:hypothetical protein
MAAGDNNRPDLVNRNAVGSKVPGANPSMFTNPKQQYISTAQAYTPTKIDPDKTSSSIENIKKAAKEAEDIGRNLSRSAKEYTSQFDDLNTARTNQLLMLEKATEELKAFLKVTNISIESMKETKAAMDKLTEAEKALDAGMEARNKSLLLLLQATLGVSEAKLPQDQLEKFEQLAFRLVKAQQSYNESLSASATGLLEHLNAFEKIADSGADSKTLAKKSLKELTEIGSEFTKKVPQLIAQLASGMLAREDVEALDKIFTQSLASSGATKKEIADALERHKEVEKEIEKLRTSGQLEAAQTLAAQYIKGLGTAFNHITLVTTQKLEDLGALETDMEKYVKKLEESGKAGTLRHKLAKMTIAAGGKGVTAESLGAVKGSRIDTATGGAAGDMAGKYLKSDGTFNKGAFTKQIFNHVTDTLAKDRIAYRDYGRQYGTGGTGAMDRAAPWVGHQGRMDWMGVKTGVGSAEANKAFGEVASTYRVGDLDPQKRYDQMKKITEEIIKQGNLLGLQTAQIAKMGAAYRDNLGKGVTDSKNAAYAVGIALDHVNKEITDPDMKASSSQLATLLTNIASESEMFGKNIVDANRAAEIATTTFAKMGIPLEKAKKWVEDIAKLQSGASSLGGGLGAEIARFGNKYQTADQAKMEKSFGGKKIVEEMKQIAASGDYDALVDKTEENLKAQGKTEEAKRLRQSYEDHPELVGRALASTISGDQTHVQSLGDKDALRAQDILRGAIGETYGKSQFEVMEEKAEDLKKARKGPLGSSAAQALGYSEDDVRALSNIDKAKRNAKKSGKTSKEEYDKLMKEQEGKADKSTKGEAGIGATMDLKGTMAGLTGAVSKNTLALMALTAVMVGSFLNDITGGKFGKSVLGGAKKLGGKIGSKLGTLGEEMAEKGGRMGKAGEWLSKKFGGKMATEAGGKMATEAAHVAEMEADLAAKGISKVAGTGVQAAEVGAETATKGGWLSRVWQGSKNLAGGLKTKVGGLFGGGAEAAEAASGAANIAGTAAETAKVGKTVAALSKLKALSGFARTAAEETGWLEVAIGGFSMAAEGSDALKHKSGHYLSEQNKEMGKNWEDLKNEKGVWNTTVNTAKVLGTGVGYIGTATKEAVLPVSKALDWGLDKSGVGGVMNSMGTLLMGSSYAGTSRTDLVKDKWSSIRNFFTTGKMESDREKLNRETEEKQKKKMEGRAAIKAGDHERAKQILGADYDKEAASIKQEEKKKAKAKGKPLTPENQKKANELAAAANKEKMQGDTGEPGGTEGKETSKLASMSVETLIVKNFQMGLGGKQQNVGPFGKPRKHKGRPAAGMTPEELEKLSKDPEALKYMIDNPNMTGTLGLSYENLSPSNKQLALSLYQMRTPYESLAKTDKLLPGATDRDGKPLAPGSFDADMSYKPDTKEIIFKVANAQQVLSAALGREFRNNAPLPQ